MRPITLIVTSSSAWKPTPHTVAPTVIGGAPGTIGSEHNRMRAGPVCGLIGCGGKGPGHPIGFAVIGGHRFGARDGGTSGWFCVGAASGSGVVRVCGPGAVVVRGADPLGLEVDPTLAWALDAQAAVRNPISTIALNVACLVMVIGL